MGVLNCGDIALNRLVSVFAPYDLSVTLVDDNQPIPGSWFGEPEAGLKDQQLYVRNDTPVHSALHEGCHYICMDAQRRANLDTNAEGGYDEENGVCYLQILLAEQIPAMGRSRMLSDMDEWGYSFRLGSSKAWFEQDAEDARDWLITHAIIDKHSQATGRLRL